MLGIRLNMQGLIHGMHTCQTHSRPIHAQAWLDRAMDTSLTKWRKDMVSLVC